MKECQWPSKKNYWAALLADYKNPEDLIEETELLKQLIKTLLERVLEEELADTLGTLNMLRLPPRAAMINRLKPSRVNVAIC